MSGGGGEGNQTITTRYAEYLEQTHNTLLNVYAAESVDMILANPWAGFTDIVTEDAFFGEGYTIASFPSLYDMYGKFMAGLDVEVLWAEVFADTVNSSEVAALVSAEGALMDDDIDDNVLPRFQTGMRDMNAVMGSTYVIGRSLIEDARVKQLEKFSSQLRYNLIPVAQARWVAHLDWNKLVVATYAELMKLYYSAKTDVEEFNRTNGAKSALWAYTVHDYHRVLMGTMQGATTTTKDSAGASGAQKVLSGAMSGAAMGAMIGSSIKDTSVGAASGATYSGYGAVAGAALGIAASYTY